MFLVSTEKDALKHKPAIGPIQFDRSAGEPDTISLKNSGNRRRFYRFAV
jgi:hypothetical protein